MESSKNIAQDTVDTGHGTCNWMHEYVKFMDRDWKSYSEKMLQDIKYFEKLDNDPDFLNSETKPKEDVF